MSFRHSQGAGALRGFQDRLQALVRGHDLLTQKDLAACGPFRSRGSCNGSSQGGTRTPLLNCGTAG